MAFKDSDWLETNYCTKIQNHLFTLVSQEPLYKDKSCFQESSSKKAVDSRDFRECRDTVATGCRQQL